MKNKLKLFLPAAVILLLVNSCQKMDRPSLGDFPTDDKQVLLPGNLRFFVDFNKTTGISPRWNAADSISGNPAMLFPFTYEAGINGNCMKGNDNGAILYLNANDMKNATSLTIAFWMKNKDAGRTEFLFSLVDEKYGWSNSTTFLLLEHGSTTATTFKFSLMDQWLEFPDGNKFNKPLLDGNWHHVAMVYDEVTSKVTYYFDGAVVTGAPASATDVKNGSAPRGKLDFSTVKNMIIGGWNKHGGAKGPTDDWIKTYSGNLDQFRMYNKALSAAEVQALFAGKL